VGQIISLEELAGLREQWRREKRRVVAASGAFDLLHPGHVRLLEQARSLGGIVVVAVEDDAAVRATMQKDRGQARVRRVRPVAPQAERAEILAALAAVDYVTELQNVSVESWIKQFQPDVYVQGGAASSADAPWLRDYGNTGYTGPEIVKIPLEPGYSTALLIERIQQLRQ
jgi:D-glycero-beta-D-manno-heptose 1-phosphate adenylyltransferase